MCSVFIGWESPTVSVRDGLGLGLGLVDDVTAWSWVNLGDTSKLFLKN